MFIIIQGQTVNVDNHSMFIIIHDRSYQTANVHNLSMSNSEWSKVCKLGIDCLYEISTAANMKCLHVSYGTKYILSLHK